MKKRFFRNWFNYILLLYLIYMGLLFVFRMGPEYRIVKNIVVTGAYIVGGLGFILCSNGYSVPGLILLFANLVLIITGAIVYGRNVLREPYSWILSVLLIYFLFMELRSRHSRGASTEGR